MTTKIHTDVTGGAPANASVVNAPLGQLDNALADLASFLGDFVTSGGLAGTSASLTLTQPAIRAFIQNTYVSLNATTLVATASKDNYVDLDSAGAYHISTVNNGAAAPAIFALSIRLYKAVASASAVTSVGDLRAGPNIAAQSVSTSAIGPYSANLPGTGGGGQLAATPTPSGVTTGKVWDFGGSAYHVRAFGAVGDGKEVTDGAITTGTPNLVCATSTPFASTDVGKAIAVTNAAGGGNPLVTTILAYVSSSAVTLAANAAATVGASPVDFGTDNRVALQAAVNVFGIVPYGPNEGGRLEWGQGVYCKTGTITVAQRGNMEWNGPRTQADTGGATIIQLDPSVPAVIWADGPATIRNLTFEAQGGAGVGTGIQLGNATLCSGSLLEDVAFFGFTKAVLLYNANDLNFRGCDFEANRTAIDATSVAGPHVADYVRFDRVNKFFRNTRDIIANYGVDWQVDIWSLQQNQPTPNNTPSIELVGSATPCTGWLIDGSWETPDGPVIKLDATCNSNEIGSIVVANGYNRGIQIDSDYNTLGVANFTNGSRSAVNTLDAVYVSGSRNVIGTVGGSCSGYRYAVNFQPGGGAGQNHLVHCSAILAIDILLDQAIATSYGHIRALGTVKETGPFRLNRISSTPTGSGVVFYSYNTTPDLNLAGGLGDLCWRSDTPTNTQQRLYICTTAGAVGVARWTEFFARGVQTPTEAVLVSGVDSTLGDLISVTLTAARVVGAPLTPVIGRRLTFTLIQGGAGAFAVTWNAVFKKTWSDAGNATGARSSITYQYDGTNWNADSAQAPYV